MGEAAKQACEVPQYHNPFRNKRAAKTSIQPGMPLIGLEIYADV